jgi:hypothetical protein
VLGRTSLVLAGAYLLRALTTSGVVAPPVGVAAGLVYALVWIAAACVAVSRGRSLSAAFHSQTAVLLAYPLIVEATSSFGTLTPGTSAVVLAIVASLVLTVASSVRLRGLAWSSTLTAVATAGVLAGTTGSWLAFGALLVWLAVLATWVGYLRGWQPLAWLTCAAADVAVLIVAARSLRPGFETPAEAASLALLLFGACMATFAVRTLVRSQPAGAFEILQGLTTVFAGFAVAIWLPTGGALAPVLGIVGLLLAVLAYAAGFVGAARRALSDGVLEFYVSLGAALILVASPVLVGAGRLTAIWIAGGVSSMVLARRFDRIVFAMHGSVFAIAAATQSGLMTRAGEAVWSSTRLGSAAVTASGLTVLCALLLVAGIPPAEAMGQPKPYVRMPKLIVLACVSFLLLGMLTHLLAFAFGAGSVVTIRTVGLAVLTLLAAAAGRLWTFREASWLVYPLLVLIGLKLVADDLFHSPPVALFVAFSAYGAALIVAPRLVRRSNA